MSKSEQNRICIQSDCAVRNELKDLAERRADLLLKAEAKNDKLDGLNMALDLENKAQRDTILKLCDALDEAANELTGCAELDLDKISLFDREIVAQTIHKYRALSQQVRAELNGEDDDEKLEKN